MVSHGLRDRNPVFDESARCADGYWVFAPDHKDALCGNNFMVVRSMENGQVRLLLAFYGPTYGTMANSYADRREDMYALVDARSA